MWNTRKRIPNFSKVIRSKHCFLCLEQRGVINKLKLCRKCVYDDIKNTRYISL